MENEILELREEIDVLNERIEYLEKRNRKLQTYHYIRILIKVVCLLLFAYGIWRGYEYVVNEVPKMMEEQIQELNPLKEKN